MSGKNKMSRRSLLIAGSAALVGAALRPSALGAATIEKRLIAGPGIAHLLGPSGAETAVWCYNGQVPGPEVRLLQNERVRVSIDNRLPQDTTIHWHGVRVPNAMDGAPDVTQAPIGPGGQFVYEFDVADAGTYWYHPHAHSSEQIGRGLAAAFIVQETQPIPVDRDIVWVLGDFRLNTDATIAGRFNSPMETAMSGRFGNTVTINGQVPEPFSVRSGERIRLRLINAAPARIFGLEFKGHNPIIIANDGQPVEPHAAEDGRIVLGPAMRIDLVIDMNGIPGSAALVADTFYSDLAYNLVEFKYSNESPLKDPGRGTPARLPANPIPEPDLRRAMRHDVTLEGGMGMAGMMRMMSGQPMWSINGVAAHGHLMGPALTLSRGGSYILAIDNQTRWHHPIHLHGHSFRVLTRNGQPTKYREWRDTVLIPPLEKADIAFVADNPGDWMFHCHILAHQEGGMMSVIRVT